MSFADDTQGVDPAGHPAAAGLGWADVLSALWRGRFLVVALTFLSLVAGLVAAAAKQNSFTSEARLLLRLGLREGITPETLHQPGRDRRDSTPSVRDEAYLLSDEAVFRELAREIGPEEILRVEDPRRFDDETTALHVRLLHSIQAMMMSLPAAGSDVLGDEERGGLSERERLHTATAVLFENTDIRVERDSNVISVTHTSSDPRTAYDRATAIVAALIDRHREQFSTLRFLDESRERVEQARLDLEQARVAYFSHVGDCGFMEVDGRSQSMLVEEKATLERELSQARMKLSEILAERDAVSVRLQDTPPMIEVPQPAVVGPNPEYTTRVTLRLELLKDRERLAFQELPLEELGRRREKLDERIAAIDEELAGIEPQLKTASPISVEQPNLEHRSLRERLADLEIEQRVLDTRVQNLEIRLANQMERIRSFHACINEHEMMRLGTESAERSFLNLSDQYATLEGLANVDLKGQVNLQLLQPPTVPLNKDGPNRKRTVLLALLGGLFTSGFLAILLYVADRRLRDPRSVERHLTLPLLGVVPEQRALRKLAARTGGGG